MNPNSDPALNYALDYKITKYKKEEKAGMNWLRIRIIPRTKISKQQKEVNRKVFRSL